MWLTSIVIYLIRVYYWNLNVSIANSCTFHLNLTCRNATNHWLLASFSLIHGSRGLHCHWSMLKDIVCKLRYTAANVLWIHDQTISITIKNAFLAYRTGGNRKRSKQSMNMDHKSLETVFLIAICRQSGDLRSTFVISINVFDFRISEVFIEYRPTEHIAKTIWNKGF